MSIFSRYVKNQIVKVLKVLYNYKEKKENKMVRIENIKVREDLTDSELINYVCKKNRINIQVGIFLKNQLMQEIKMIFTIIIR